MSTSVDPISAASTSALADLSTVQTPAVNSDPAATETPTPAVATEAAPSPTVEETTPAEPVAETPAQEAARELELIWRGQKVKLPEQEVISMAQKGYDYSQKTAELSQFRQELQTQKAALEQQANDLRQVLTDPQQLRQLVQWASQQDIPGLDPNAGVTAQQAEELIATKVQALQKQVHTDIRRAQLELETNRLEQEYTANISTHLQKLTEKYPVLQDVEGIEGLLKSEALAYQQAQLSANPGKEISVQEILGVMAKAAERRAQKIEARFTNQMKRIAVQQQAVKSTGIEAGGSAPSTQPDPQHKLNSKELREQVLRDLGAM